MKKLANREYSEDFTQFRLNELNPDGSVGADLGILNPSRRRYHGANVRLSRVTTEKDEIFLLKGNVYLSLTAYEPLEGRWAEVKAHYNPMLIFMWLGGGILLLGVAFSLWPDANPYPVYAAARRRRRRPEPGLSDAAESFASQRNE
jgi:cytochrome c biogenesis factor